MARSWRRLWFPLFVVAVVGVFCLWLFTKRSPKTPTADAQASNDAPSGYPFLDNLRPGDTLDEWTVSRMMLTESVEKKPQLAIMLERKGSGITIWVARRSNVTNPPLSTARYGISFGDARPYGEPIPADAYAKTMNEIANRLRKSEATVEPPPGL